MNFESERQPEIPGDEKPIIGEENFGENQEKMVDVERISAIFDDEKVLEKIADDLLSRGLISGFSIEPIKAGYIFRGSKIKEEQFQLQILLDPDATEAAKKEIQQTITQTIGKKWEAPAVKEDKLKVNESFLGFIGRAEIEHSRYVKEKNLRLALGLSVLTTMLVTVGFAIERYAKWREDKTTKAERSEAYEKLSKLHAEIQKQIFNLDKKIEQKEPFHRLPSDMAAGDSYEETNQILKTIRDAQEQTRLLMKEIKKPPESIKPKSRHRPRSGI